jgi:hypothetical protein
MNLRAMITLFIAFWKNTLSGKYFLTDFFSEKHRLYDLNGLANLLIVAFF